jgi:hypothetical protein
MPADLSAQTTVQRPAVLLVHSDYTARKAARSGCAIMLPDEAEALLARRVAFFNVWKPLRARVRGAAAGGVRRARRRTPDDHAAAWT